MMLKRFLYKKYAYLLVAKQLINYMHNNNIEILVSMIELKWRGTLFGKIMHAKLRSNVTSGVRRCHFRGHPPRSSQISRRNNEVAKKK